MSRNSALKSTRNSAPSSEQRSPAGEKTRPVWADLDKRERMSVVCRYFCQGYRLAKIAARISEEYSTDFSRESTYPMLMEAVRNGWIQYVPPLEQFLGDKIEKRYSWLREARVVHTSQFEDVAYYGAEMLITLLKNMRSSIKTTVHIGFAGGHAMRTLARALARLLRESEAELPEELVLHALVAGFDVFDPTTDPNSFFTLFQKHTPMGPEFKFVGLHAPTVVEADQYDSLRNLEGIKESFDQVDKLDIIVTSAAIWADEHSTFRKRMLKSPGCFDTLDKAGCIGDMLWLPLGPEGPLTVATRVRTMTLVELTELTTRIKAGKHVVLVLGPCAMCRKTKAQILRAILTSKDRLISHLVIDSLSAREILR